MLLATCTPQNMELRELLKQWLSRKGFRPVGFLFRPMDLRFCLSQRRDAFESDKIMLYFRNKIKFLYHMVKKFTSHAQLTFAPLYDKDTTAK